MDATYLLEIGLAGLGTGGLYALTGLSFVTIYKATKVVNLAIGEFLMMGAYVCFGIATSLALPMWAAIPLAVLGSGVAGALIERLAIRPMLGESPISVFMVTVGLTSILVGLVELTWTAEPRRLPEFLPNDPIMLGEAYLPSKVFWGFVIAAVLIGIALAVFRFWRGGVALRATASDQAAAYSMGIDVPRVFSLSWAVASMVAAIAGIVVGAIGGISSTMGIFGLSVLVVVIVGGLDSILGALVAGLLVGVVESYAGALLGGEYKLLATFLILVAVLMVRPYGLFGTHEIERL